MAPTEILAKQHFNLAKKIFPKDLRIEFISGKSNYKEKKDVINKILAHKIDIIFGTHAIFQKKVNYKMLGLIIIDEQHKFGVAQRSKLWHKNKLPPHILIMTATPIPRTLAMSVYGDLDMSIINELPPGRKYINTIHQLSLIHI